MKQTINAAGICKNKIKVRVCEYCGWFSIFNESTYRSNSQVQIKDEQKGGTKKWQAAVVLIGES